MDVTQALKLQQAILLFLHVGHNINMSISADLNAGSLVVVCQSAEHECVSLWVCCKPAPWGTSHLKKDVEEDGNVWKEEFDLEWRQRERAERELVFGVVWFLLLGYLGSLYGSCWLGLPGVRQKSSRLDTRHTTVFDPDEASDILSRKCVCVNTDKSDRGVAKGHARERTRSSSHMHTGLHFNTVKLLHTAVWHDVTTLPFSPLLCAASRSPAKCDLSKSLFNHKLFLWCSWWMVTLSQQPVNTGY